jgi:hypothetical protein
MKSRAAGAGNVANVTMIRGAFMRGARALTDKWPYKGGGAAGGSGRVSRYTGTNATGGHYRTRAAGRLSFALFTGRRAADIRRIIQIRPLSEKAGMQTFLADCFTFGPGGPCKS